MNYISAQTSCGTPENPCDGNWNNFDYANPSAKVETIPTDKVNVDEVLANNRGNELTVEQIKANLDKIKNLNQVNLENARKAVQEAFGVSITDFGKGSNLVNGVFQATFGKQDKVTLSNEMYKKGRLRVNEQGEIVFSPGEELPKFDIPKGDKLILEDVKEPSEFQDHSLQGTFRVNEDGTVVFLKGKEAVMDGIYVTPMFADAVICKTESECSGDYIFLGEKFRAEGNGLKLRFTFASFLNVFDMILPGEFFFLNQNDFKEIILGDGQQRGRIEIKDKDGQLTEIVSKGWVRIENDENIITDENGKLSKNLFKNKIVSPEALESLDRGSVSSALVFGDGNEVLIFDENQNAHVIPKKTYDEMIEKRKALLDRGISLSGYFTITELDLFKNELDLIENKLNIDFKKINLPVEGDVKAGLVISEFDKRLRTEDERAAVTPLMPTNIYWAPYFDFTEYEGLSWLKRLSAGEDISSYERTLGHELGHNIEALSSPYSVSQRHQNPSLIKETPLFNSFKEKANEFNMRFGDKPDQLNYFLFPTGDSKENIKEYIAEISNTLLHNPAWFTDPYNAGMSSRGTIIKLAIPLRKDDMRKRQEFGNIFLKELEKYKKDNP
ncbi:hypothetical protein HYY71_04960 [Candidatus Woesearchaeota archaeon]|nr:hypothetical protein [Candidatus Woesearchaeota archaeon]